MSLFVTSELFDERMILAGLGVGAGGSGSPPTPLVGQKMGLFTNVFVPTKTNLTSDFTEPTYPGYVRQALHWSLPKRDQLSNISTDTGLMSWQMNDNTVPTTVVGWFAVDPTGLYLMSGLLPAPVSLTDALSFLGIIAEFSQSANNPGNTTVVS